MVRTAGLLLICVAACLGHAPVAAATLWENYVAKPSPANAKEVEVIEYDDQVSAKHAAERTTADIRLLAVQVFSGDRESFRLVLRLMRSEDGANLEDLAEIAGRFLRQNPRAYLEDVLTRGKSKSCPGATFIGEQYVDRESAHSYEVAARIDALMTVNDTRLRELRDACISKLKE